MNAEIEQRTDAWKDLRYGRITGSRINDVLTRPKKGQKESITRANYRAQLVCERLTQKPMEDQFVTWYMKRGIELEPLARVEYEMRQGVIVDSAGFQIHPTMPFAGASPDGFIGIDGLVEFKCVTTAKHIEWRLAKMVPAEHKPQILFELACSGRKWADFVSFEPNLPDSLQLFICRLHRDEIAISEIEEEVRKLNAEVEEMIARLNNDSEDLTDVLSRNLDRAVKGMNL